STTPAATLKDESTCPYLNLTGAGKFDNRPPIVLFSKFSRILYSYTPLTKYENSMLEYTNILYIWNSYYRNLSRECESGYKNAVKLM
ncbi:MAG: hypothetical protein ACRD5B_18800, partial [Nitrososphaeraceae archaeon]